MRNAGQINKIPDYNSSNLPVKIFAQRELGWSMWEPPNGDVWATKKATSTETAKKQLV